MKPIRVMLVDDELAVRGMLKKTIPFFKYNMEVVGEAGSGVEALHEIERVDPEFVIADIKMPFMDGIEFSRVASKQNPDLVIFIVTAYDEFELARDALRAGVTDYFLKPVMPDEIDEQLKKVEQKVYEIRKRKGEQDTSDMVAPKKLADQVNSYIIEHYRDPELNVASVSEALGFNRSYLSRAYKKETGGLLIDYLIAFRMEMAKKMAAGGEKMYIIAEKVGMPDPNYFGKCFKKYTGMSFRDYQKSIEDS